MKHRNLAILVAVPLLLASCNALTRGLDRSQAIVAETGTLAVTTADAHAQLRAQLAAGTITLQQFNEASAAVSSGALEAAALITESAKAEFALLKTSIRNEATLNAPQAANTLIGGLLGGQDIISALVGAGLALAGGGAVSKGRKKAQVEAAEAAHVIAKAATAKLAEERNASRAEDIAKAQA